MSSTGCTSTMRKKTTPRTSSHNIAPLSSCTSASTRLTLADVSRRSSTVKFSAVNTDDEDAMVDKVAPTGFFWVYPTSQNEIVTAGVSKAGGRVLGADLHRRGAEAGNGGGEGCDKCGIVRGAIETLDRSATGGAKCSFVDP